MIFQIVNLLDAKKELFKKFTSAIVTESELFTGDTFKDNHSPGPVNRGVSP